MRFYLSFSLFVAILFSAPATMAANNTYVFAVPPRESAAKAQEVYGPIADFLSRQTGHTFILKYTDNWLSFEDDMHKDKFDLVFDGPAFIAWRVKTLQHKPLLRFAPNLLFTVIAKTGNAKVNQVSDLVGHKVCAFPPPFLGTLLLNNLFDNPSRQPVLIRVPNLKAMYDGVVTGKCDGAIVNDALLKKFDGENHNAKAIYHYKPVPNQGFTAGPRIPPEIQQKIVQALMSPEGELASARLREEFGNLHFVPAEAQQYAGFDVLLKDVWGFGG
jgi:ABC-type phosphate/phosphonate transport system substrate-binding protein